MFSPFNLFYINKLQIPLKCLPYVVSILATHGVLNAADPTFQISNNWNVTKSRQLRKDVDSRWQFLINTPNKQYILYIKC